MPSGQGQGVCVTAGWDKMVKVGPTSSRESPATRDVPDLIELIPTPIVLGYEAAEPDRNDYSNRASLRPGRRRQADGEFSRDNAVGRNLTRA